MINSIQDNAQNIAGYALTGVSVVGNSLLNLVLALVLVFFFLKDGPRFVPWLSAQTGPRAARHVAALSYKSWDTLSEFIRQQALVGFIDAFFIGLGLWILGVPLVIPLAVLTFFGGFIPIIGAFVAGAFAVLIALVSNGFTTALIVLGIVILVQQIEGNILQPIIQGRGLQPACRRGHPRRHGRQQPGRHHRRLPQRADRGADRRHLPVHPRPARRAVPRDRARRHGGTHRGRRGRAPRSSANRSPRPASGPAAPPDSDPPT